MIPGATTGPGENRENLGRRAEESTNHGEQVRHTRNFCNGLTKNDTTFKPLVEEFYKGTKTREQLKEEFKKRLKGINAEERAKMGIISAGPNVTDDEINTFLSQTGSFDNQLMAGIESDQRAREKAREALTDSCLEVAHDEYGNFDETELRASLKREKSSRLLTFLDTPKYRKSYLSKLPGSSALTEKDFSDVNFSEITQAISKLSPTNPKRQEIQEAWLKISHVAHPDSNLASAFYTISHEGGKVKDMAGAYGAFFSDKNTLISRANREKILNFLITQYTPVVPLSVLTVIDPKTSQRYVTSEGEEAEIEKNLPSDPQLAAAVRADRREQWEKIHKTYIGGGKNMIGSRSLPFETKVRILSQFGSIGKAEKMRDSYYRGIPNSLRSTTDTEGSYREKFRDTYGIDTEKVDTKSGLTEELIAKLGHQIDGIEHFDTGCAMEWKTKNKDGEVITGYYIIDTVPGDTLDEENILTVRFLGDDNDPLSPGGMAHYYTGADFYEYLSGCAEDGKITFRERGEFDEEISQNTKNEKYPRYFSEIETQTELRNQFPDIVEVQSREQFNREVDNLLNPAGNNPKEEKSSKEREIYEGMIFCKTTPSGIDTFQVQSIDEETGTITLWDGWGTGKKSVIELSFADFIRTLKSMSQGDNTVHRVPTGGKKIDIDIFNTLCSNKDQYDDSFEKKIGRITIRESNGENAFGQYNEKTGNFEAIPVIKIGDKKDLYIESIDGSKVTYRVGTFTQGESNKEKGTWKKKPGFSGSPELTMSLEMLWAYLQNNQSFSLERPLEKPEIDESKQKDSKSMSWWNIMKHSHSWGVLLHGDLWKAPFKAWEEQHHKDHDFHGKITAALAMEKLQGGKGPISGLLNWAEWPTLMVADGNSSLHSYLDELVNKIDGMGSYHRTRLIKKWGKNEHFPAPKFMAAMFASMKIFGQLYPYDYEDSDYKSKDGSHEWVWYNSIVHSLDPHHAKYHHMPPHHGEEWPKEWTNKEGNKMNEVDACYAIFNKFEHPMLKNLGRRFQKYMNAGQTELVDGGEGNLKQRTTMTEKLDWMMATAVNGKPPELFGASTELWLSEGYPTHVTTMPYAAMLFGHREEQMLSPTREHIKSQFQSGYHIPMFVFMQNKDLADTFRTTSIAFAYTISDDCGRELEKLTKETADHRLSGRSKKWGSRFQSFWTKHGTELMHKITGMRDPMLNLMMSDPPLFDKLLEKQPAKKRKQYEMLREKKSVIKLYYGRIADTYGDSPGHAQINRGEGYYSGDHFRYRKGFESGVPIAWVNWSNYLDGNLTDEFASGSQSRSGDGIFWELKGFLSDIPKLARKIAVDMGYSENDTMVQDIAESLYTKNVTEIKKETQSKLKPENKSANYATMFGMMFELVEPKRIQGAGDGPEDIARNKKYFEQIKACLATAKEIEKGPGGFPAAIEYRSKVAANWEKIVEKGIETENMSLKDIEEGRFDGSVGELKSKTQGRSGAVLQEKKDAHDERARQRNETTAETRSGAAADDELGLIA